MNKKFVFGILGSVLLLTIIGVYIVLGSLDQPSGKNDSSADPTDTGGDVEAVSGKGEGSGAITATSNPFEENVKTPLKEELFQQYIHAMSHQKVEAVEKWSFFKITDERIDFLLNQLEVNNYKNERLYREILTSWKEGDFSSAASQHNAVWKLQEGTIGKASGVLSPEAEEAYLQKQNEESR
jgi:hypothetical protein